MNRQQINKTLRAITSECKDGCSCSLCNSKKNIQQHHIIPIRDLGVIAWRNGYNTKDKLETMYAPTVMLCDECHENFHAIMCDSYKEPNIDIDTAYKIVDIISSVDLSLASEDLYRDYCAKYNDMVETVCFAICDYCDELDDEDKEEIRSILLDFNDIEYYDERS